MNAIPPRLPKVRHVLVAVDAVALVAPATALATPINNSPVGGQLQCNAGSWSSSGTGLPYSQSTTWYQNSTGGTQLATGYGCYTPVAGDIGHRLVCQVVEYDQTDSTTATAVGVPTAPVLPIPAFRSLGIRRRCTATLARTRPGSS